MNLTFIARAIASTFGQKKWLLLNPYHTAFLLSLCLITFSARAQENDIDNIVGTTGIEEEALLGKWGGVGYYSRVSPLFIEPGKSPRTLTREEHEEIAMGKKFPFAVMEFDDDGTYDTDQGSYDSYDFYPEIGTLYVANGTPYKVRHFSKEMLSIEVPVAQGVIVYPFYPVIKPNPLTDPRWHTYFDKKQFRDGTSLVPDNFYQAILIYEDTTADEAKVKYEPLQFSRSNLPLEKDDLIAFIIGSQFWVPRKVGSEEKWVIITSNGPISVMELPKEVDGSLQYVEYYQKYDQTAVLTAGLVLGFKKRMSKVTAEYEELSEKIAGKEKGYGALHFKKIVEEYNDWVMKEDPEKHRRFTPRYAVSKEE